MTLTFVVDLILQLLGAVANLVGISNGIRAGQANQALDTTPYYIHDKVTGIEKTVDDISYGNFALAGLIATARTDILAAIAALPGALTPVTLPTIPPSGYGSPTDQEITDAVWEGIPTTWPHSAGGALLQTVNSVGYYGYVDLPVVAGQFRVSSVSLPANDYVITTYSVPVFTAGNILSTDSLLSYLTRDNPTFIVGYKWFGQTFVNLLATYPEQVSYTSVMDEQDFLLYKATIFPNLVNVAAPIWPGIADVTLGTPVALAAGVTVPGPLDGVLVSITSTPSYTGLFDFDGDPSYRNVGAITFQSDNGQDELPQTLGFASAIYCPRQMATASLAKVRTPGAIVGTVTPWTRN
jgi:hypothetical protein